MGLNLKVTARTAGEVHTERTKCGRCRVEDDELTRVLRWPFHHALIFSIENTHKTPTFAIILSLQSLSIGWSLMLSSWQARTKFESCINLKLFPLNELVLSISSYDCFGHGFLHLILTSSIPYISKPAVHLLRTHTPNRTCVLRQHEVTHKLVYPDRDTGHIFVVELSGCASRPALSRF